MDRDSANRPIENDALEFCWDDCRDPLIRSGSSMRADEELPKDEGSARWEGTYAPRHT